MIESGWDVRATLNTKWVLNATHATIQVSHCQRQSTSQQAGWMN